MQSIPCFPYLQYLVFVAVDKESKQSWKSFHLFGIFQFEEKFWGDCLICWKCCLFFRILLWVSTVLKPFSVFYSKIDRRNRCVLKMIFLYWIFCEFWNIICGSCRYITRNLTMILRLFTCVCICCLLCLYFPQ